jgi:hypothetical protein
MRIADAARMPKLCTRWSWLVVAVLLLAAGRADAQSVTLAWDPNSENDLAGYIIGYGTIPGQNQKTVDVGMATQWTLAGLSAGKTYYFRVFAYNAAGAKSAPSKEVSTTLPGSSPAPGGCIGQPPAAGWTCQNGGWLPPDSPLNNGGGSPSPSPTPAPAPQPSGCPGSAPGAGWVCQDGNWLPPDSPLLYSAPTPPSCPGSAPGVMWTCVNGNWLPPADPQPSGPSSPTPCPGTAPGVGWVCQSGNWLPPDHPLLLNPPVATPTACAGSAPGLGWICQDGNWLPPDHPLVRRSGGQ